MSSRRDVLGGLLIGFVAPLAAGKAWAIEQAGRPKPTFDPGEKLASGGFMPNAFIRITADGKITLVMPQVEMGQGIYTAEAMLMAEELEVGLDQLTLEAAPPNEALYKQPLLQFQGTGGSTSIRGGWEPLRQAGAAARTMLVQAAAQGWGVDPAACRASRGVVTHPPSGRSAPYGALVGAAQRLPIPKQVVLKDPGEFAIIGKSTLKLDSFGKTNGSAVFGIDTTLPGMKFATARACPEFGGALGAVDDTAARSVAGYRGIIRLPAAVATVGDTTWAALKAMDALQIQWISGPNARLHTDDIVRDLDQASAHATGLIGRQDGDYQGAIKKGQTRLDATYVVPFLAHATMEPMNTLVHVQPDSCHIWVGTQVPTRAQAIAAQLTGLPPEKVFVHNQLLGGGFGRRLEVDSIEQAVGFARQVSFPLKVTWTREEDIRHDTFRPAYHHRISAALDGGGAPIAYGHRITGASVTARFAPEGLRKDGLDSDCVESAAETPYAYPNMVVDYVRRDPPKGVPYSWWRGVGPTHNVFVVESFNDEMAHAAGQDPVAFRRKLLRHNPRALRVLDLAVETSGWGSGLPHRVGRGVSLQDSFGSYVACVAEVEVADDGEIRIRRATVAVDCGQTVNPNTVAAQLEGGLIFGWTAALYGGITIENGRVQQGNFNDYRMMRMNETPPIAVYQVRSADHPGGIGETGTVAAAPALCNAIFAATGVRIRRLPIDRNLLAVRGSERETSSTLQPAFATAAAAGATALAALTARGEGDLA